jgi:hypothetical protein
MIDNFLVLSNNMNALSVCKKAITKIENPKTIKKLQEKVMENTLMLIQSPFGNYAIQALFDHWSNDLVIPIIENLYNRFYYLSMHKYSSNVVEQCLLRNNEEIVKRFIFEVCQYNRIVGKINLINNI